MISINRKQFIYFFQQTSDNYCQKFANELGWLFRHNRMHSAACIHLDICLLVALLADFDGNSPAGMDAANKLPMKKDGDTKDWQQHQLLLVRGLAKCAELHLGFSYRKEVKGQF